MPIPSKTLRNACKKRGIRLTTKKRGKRIYKSSYALEKQLKSSFGTANKQYCLAKTGGRDRFNQLKRQESINRSFYCDQCNLCSIPPYAPSNLIRDWCFECANEKNRDLKNAKRAKELGLKNHGYAKAFKDLKLALKRAETVKEKLEKYEAQLRGQIRQQRTARQLSAARRSGPFSLDQVFPTPPTRTR